MYAVKLCSNELPSEYYLENVCTFYFIQLIVSRPAFSVFIDLQFSWSLSRPELAINNFILINIEQFLSYLCGTSAKEVRIKRTTAIKLDTHLFSDRITFLVMSFKVRIRIIISCFWSVFVLASFVFLLHRFYGIFSWTEVVLPQNEMDRIYSDSKLVHTNTLSW